jgi:sugar/nucleoside kinase (ribokinase family)
MMAIAALGGRCILSGKVGNGKFGRHFEEVISREGVTPRLLRSANSRTGKVLNFVTPDADRTFGVSLGAASRVDEKSILEDDIAQSRIFYFTGYEFESINAAVMRAIELAKKHRTLVVMDLADPEIVKRNMGGILDIMKYVDIVFMNEDEAKRFTGLEPKEAAKAVGEYVPVVIVKAGPQGSFVVSEKKSYRISPFEAKAVDTTGAGDLYAAGFLYSYLKDRDIRKAGKMGSFMGAKAVSQMGALLSDEMKKVAKEMFENGR